MGLMRIAEITPFVPLTLRGEVGKETASVFGHSDFGIWVSTDGIAELRSQ